MNREINSILKVNHAGEFAAIEIYKTQLFISRILYPDLCSFLKETLSHEKMHHATFRALMTTRGGKPCRAVFFWARGGCALGIITALMGRKAIMACTAAVERTVHHHMNDQIAYLAGRDEEVRKVVENVRDEEVGHLKYAEDNIGKNTLLVKIIDFVVTNSTEAIIWLSTWGAVQRLEKEICTTK